MDSACRSIHGAPGLAGSTIMGLQAGEFLIFPSWLQHHVPLHQGDLPRVSISFNVRASGGESRGALRLMPAIPGSKGATVASWLQPAWRRRQLFDNPILR